MKLLSLTLEQKASKASNNEKDAKLQDEKCKWPHRNIRDNYKSVLGKILRIYLKTKTCKTNHKDKIHITWAQSLKSLTKLYKFPPQSMGCMAAPSKIKDLTWRDMLVMQTKFPIMSFWKFLFSFVQGAFWSHSCGRYCILCFVFLRSRHISCIFYMSCAIYFSDTNGWTVVLKLIWNFWCVFMRMIFLRTLYFIPVQHFFFF